MSARVVTTTIETYLGGYLDYLDPRAEDIELADIARGLAHTCRFAGQTTRFYSVAEHAIYVRNLVIAAGHPELALAALHHDSHEAYLGDWPTPLKVALGGDLERLRRSCDEAIGEKFGIDTGLFDHPAIKEADTVALFREAATLKPSRGVGDHWGNWITLPPIPGAGLPPEYAERLFVNAHNGQGDGHA